MKKVVLLVLFLLGVSSSYAQFQERIGVKSVIGAAASHRDNLGLQLTQTINGASGTFTIKSVGIQVGLPYMGVTNVPQNNNPSQNYITDLGFPWGILYRYQTFSEDAFTVSKGYFTDKIAINWQVKANLGLITDFLIYRTTDLSSSNTDWGSPIATLSSNARSYDDTTSEGGKLYQYKVEARGVESVQNQYSSYISGIGYRNPTAVITGNVSFNSGTPVKDVLISASPTGSTLNFGSSLRIPGTTSILVPSLHKNLQDAFTLQAWVKPETDFNNDEIKLYTLVSNQNDNLIFKVKLGLINGKNTLTLTLEQPNRGDQIVTLSDYIPAGEVDNKGEDVLVPITNVNGSFTHFSAVLRNNLLPEFYINGRLISAAYATKINTILNNNKTPGTTAPTVTYTATAVNAYLNTSRSQNPQTWRAFDLGGGKTAFLDELRVWETALTAAQIQTDFRRYIKGNESYLHTYLRANENAGGIAYDLSSTGFNFHGNNADLSRSSSSNISTSSAGLVQTGLFVNLEPGQTTSYPGSGSVWTNIGSGGATYNATLQNAPVYNANYGGNFSFNGINQSTEISRPVQDDFTLSAWFKTSSNGGTLPNWWTGMGIIDGEVPGNTNDFGLTMAQGKLMFGTGNPDIAPLTSANTYNDNNWHHVVCTRVKLTGALVMYVDGVQVATGTGNTNSLNIPSVLRIGKSAENRFFQGNISSINIYNNALTATQVQQNYNYFFSRYQEPTQSSFSNTIPTNTQLGILGVTDQSGNFVISAVPYTGNGNSYTLVPSLGVHQFNPNQQMVYVGVGATVLNNINFKDISSFSFKGIALYDSRGVFPKTADAPITGDIRDNESYNAYVKGNEKFQKGQYWAETNAAGAITSLSTYARVPVPGATVSIDGQPVVDADNMPVVTNIDGEFTIQVPIGQHAITVSKSGHEFSHEGRFPAKTSSVVNGQTVVVNTLDNFFQDRLTPITFIDNTKVTVIGRVVGGLAQADQVIGFGDTGKKTHTYRDAGGVNQEIVYTSINNIGQATLTLGHMPASATSVTPEYRTTFQTNAETGEYRVRLLPLNYILSQNDLVFKNGVNPGGAPLLSQDQTINFTAINSSKTPTFSQGSTTINGTPYQEILKFTYTANPTFRVLSQNSDTQITADGQTYTIAADQTPPIYSQFNTYKIEIKGTETYKNHDNSVTTPVISEVPVTGGDIIATNNLALPNSEKTETSLTDSTILEYSFRGGMPNTDAASGYTRNMTLLYRLNGIDYPLSGYNDRGILLGGESDGTQSFVTAGPQVPDFVLRDPPGSGSSATIDKGSSFTFSKESSFAVNSGSETSASVSLGSTFEVGGSITGPVTKVETINSLAVGLSMSQSASNGSSIENTYTFNQSISTSDDPNWVGSDADLYIGYSANQIYGTYNKLTASTTQSNSVAPIKVVPLPNTTTNVIYPKVNRAIYFNEAPEKTFFVYSQRSIIEDLIPKYEEFVSQIESGQLIENTNGVLSKNAYLSSINLWKKIILNNELTKYKAFNDKDQLRGDLNNILEGLKNPVTNLFSNAAKDLKNLLNATFFENISLDAGVGGITKSYQVDRISSSSLSYELQLDASITREFGLEVNDFGATLASTRSAGFGLGLSDSNQSSKTAIVSYTLSDTDDGNLLSVDAINPFDGNGPIFITKAGETSCPNEEAELTYYYKPGHPNTAANATIEALADADRVPLSVATVALEVPEIEVVTSSNLTGVFEGRNAEFVLRLRNRSTVNKDATFMLVVDQTTNPDNALINIDPNGTFITIPAGQTVTYTMTLKKVKADQYNYNNIKVSLQSTCDDNVSMSKEVSVSFVPACSTVSVMEPSNNWLMNINTSKSGNVTVPLNIKLGDFITTFSSFKQINLEYRMKGSPNWIGLKTYYNIEADYTAAITGGDTNVELIEGRNQLNYAWDIAALGLSNGTYEIRARSTCTNSTVYESAIIQGIVDRTAPVLFGTPTPTNGILGIGNDIAVRFSEPVKINTGVSRFEFKVQQNQSPARHQVSLSFNGASNTATINKPYITTGDFSIEFWLKNLNTTGSATLMNQSGGLKVELIGNVMKYTLGGQSISATILNNDSFNHYTLSYNAAIPSLSIIENDLELSSTKTPNPTTTLSFTNANPIVIGGNTFKGNIHDLRLWSKAVTRDQSVANMNEALNGNENGILGLWPINEGNGSIANDIARFKHLVIQNANWDIFPKGNAYDFDGTKHLTTNGGTFSKVVISKEMNATVSFWMKTAQANATVLSNGKGDTSDFVESNGFRNKWAFNTTASGGLELAAEGNTYAFGTMPVNDNSWHHVALSLTRNGGLNLYIDGNQVGSYSTGTIGGLASTKLFIGARGQANATSDGVDRYFNGQLDELCIWNLAKTADQIKADMYFEQNYETTGLLFYSNFNKPEITNTDGPRYYYPYDAFEQRSDTMLSFVPTPVTAPSIVSTGLVVNLDPGQTSSYAGSGNVWTNIGSGGATYNATLQNAPTFSASNSGSLVFNGTNQFTVIARPVQDDLTISSWFKTTSTAGTLGSWHLGIGLIDGAMAGNVADFGLTMGQGKLMFGTGNQDVTITSPNTYNDGNWHNVMATRTKATGVLSMYVDGVLVASNTGSTITLNASNGLNIGRSSAGKYFPGNMSAVNIYNTALSATEALNNFNALKGRFYAQPTSSAPGGSIAFTDVTPAIKPFPQTEDIPVDAVINGDQILLVPDIDNKWAKIEGKVANILVGNLNDMYDNRQESPITWTALINKNPIKMFVEGQGDIVNLVKTTDLPLTFPITVLNQGGTSKPYSFTVPSWLKLSSSSGVIDPNKSTTITATVDMNLAPGAYDNIISLTSDYGIDNKIQLKLRVLVNEPVLNFNPANFTESMNIVAKIKVEGIFSNDIYDRIYAVGIGANGLEVRGKAALTFDAQLNTYNAFLTVYSNVVSGENISFFIWDASQGNFVEATLNNSVAVPFVADSIIGNITSPAICENTNVAGQLVPLQTGWTWVSFNVNDPRFGSLNNLTAGTNLSTSDQIQSSGPALFDSYQFYSTGSASNGWSGGITSSGGITTNKMYKIKIAKGGEFRLKGIPADLNTWSFSLQQGWNWLPYVANKNIPIGDALANLNPVDGDIIKSQSLFAIYSSEARAWKGSLTYLNQSQGYMIKVTNAQTLTYPAYINNINTTFSNKKVIGINDLKANSGSAKNIGLVGGDEDNTTAPLSANYSKFPNTMNAVVKLPQGFNELYLYNDAHELRGDCKTINVDGQDLAFITIYGEKAENLTAFIGANNQSQQTTKTFKFSSDLLLGSIAQPILIELATQELSIYPNPFHDEVTIVLDSKEKGTAKITINSITGQKLYDKNFNVTAGTNVLKVQPNVPTGVYLMSVEIDGKVIVNKIIKD